MPSTVLAYFLTWTCRGTWLHGDERGSVDREHNRPLTPLLPADPAAVARDTALLRDPASTLSDRAREIVEETIRRHCAIRDWRLFALNARTNHVHVVVDCRGSCPPETALDQFKSWCTRRLREAGAIAADARPWTQHGSTRWLKDRDSLAQTIDYVENHQ